MPSLFWLDVIAYAISTVGALALALMVLGLGPGRTLNRLFALYMLVAAIWTAMAMLLRLSLWLGRGNAALFGEVSTLAFLLLGPLLLAFTVRYVGRPPRWVDVAVGVGLVVLVVVLVPLFLHQAVYDHFVGANGTTHHTVGPWGFLIAVMPALYLIWALVLFWLERRRMGEPYLALSVVSLLVGLVVGGLLDIAIPVLSFATSASVAILGYGVVSRQLLNPLRDKTEALQQEIAERRKAEQALRKSKERYRTLFEGIPLALYRTAEDGRILDANPALMQMLGIDERAVLLAANAADFYADQSTRDQWKDMMDRAQVVRDFEVQFRRRDGTIIWVRNNSRAVRDGEGKILYYEGSLEDITERKHLEEQFRQMQKMDALGRLAGGVAHDFNNLLTVIGVGSQMLERQLHPQDPSRENLNQIQDAYKRATTLTRQLLSFSRQQVGEPHPLSLNQVIGDLSRMLQRIIGEDVHLVLDCQDDLWPVYVDPSQVDQVIMNLAVNARDAMPQGGTLTIETRNVVLDKAYADHHVDARPGEHVLLSMRDTGVGMDESVKPHIFEPFFTTKDEGKGTGLGLSTVYGIVKKSGGHTQVESELGRGSTFQIYLPRGEGTQGV